MIQQVNYEDGTTLSYSDKGVLIHGGFPEADYESAIDPTDLILSGERVYYETNIPIEPEEPEESVED